MSSITSALAINTRQLSVDPAKPLVASQGGASMREIAEHTAATTGQVANPKDVGQQFEATYLRQMLDEMNLGGLFRFVAANPIAVMEMLAPQ
jgi:hypothetical protein